LPAGNLVAQNEQTVFDSHCHLDLPAFDQDREEVLARAAAAGIRTILIPAIRPATFQRLAALTTSAPVSLVRAIGVHPQVVAELDPQEMSLALDPQAIAAAARAAGAVAIGECGLDGGSGGRDVQVAVLRAHVRAARLTGLPLVLHVLRAHGQAPAILKEERAHEVGGVMHSYSGGAALVATYRDLNLAFSLAGPVTFAGARRPLEAVRAVPDDLLLLETDAPDQSPQGHRGTRNEPGFLPEIVAAAAAARGTSAAALGALTEGNARRVFKLPIPEQPGC
jgi:TatD DNase family protein